MFLKWIFFSCFFFTFFFSKNVNISIFDYLQKIEENDSLLESYKKNASVLRRGKEYLWHTTFLPTLNFQGFIAQTKVPIEQTNYSASLSFQTLLPFTSTVLAVEGAVANQINFFNPSERFIWNPNFSFSISQPLLRNGLIPALFVNDDFNSPIQQKIDIDSMVIQFNDLEVKHRYNKLVYNGTIDFLQYVYYQELLKIFREITENSRKLYLFNLQRYKKKIIADSEYLQSEINYLEIKQNYDSVKDDAEKLKFKILINLGYDPEKAKENKLNLKFNLLENKNLLNSSIKINEEEIYNLSLKKKKNLQSALLEEKKLNLQINGAINDTLPKMDINFGMTQKSSGADLETALQNDFSSEFRVGFNFSAYLSPVVYTQLETYRLNRERVKLQIKSIKKNLRIKIRESALEIIKNKKAVITKRKTYQLKKKVYKYLKKDYENGKIDYRFFIDAINDYRNSYQNYLDITIRYQFSLLKFYYEFADMKTYQSKIWGGR